MIRDRRFWLLFGIALIVRIVLMPRPEPIDFDLVYFLFPWMRYSATHSIVEFYLYGDPVVNYPPLFVVLLVGLSKLYVLLVPSLEITPLQYVLIKLPIVVADMATGAVIYLAVEEIERRLGKVSRLPLLAAGLWLLNPSSIYVSSVWGQFEAIQALWMMAALLAAVKQRWGWSGIFMALAMLTKTQAITIAPLLAVLALWSGWRSLLRWGITTAGVMLASLLPFWVGGARQPILNLYLDAVGFFPAMSMNAYNPWFIAHIRTRELLGHWVEDSTALVGPITIRHVGMMLVIAYTLLVLFLFYRHWLPSRRQAAAKMDALYQVGVFFAAGLLIFGFFMLATEMHERYILPALAPLAVAAALIKPARLPFALLSVTVFLNLIHVLPLTRAQIQWMETLPDIRFMISITNTALLAWWTAVFARRTPTASATD
ncbi:MAG: glycosyltransferase 87 family protein [Anaerolineae bacterium]